MLAYGETAYAMLDTISCRDHSTADVLCNFSTRKQQSRQNARLVSRLLLSLYTLQDHAEIPVPPSKEDFVMTGNLQKRRGGFGKMSQQRWKNRCFVLLKTGNLCYFQVGDEPHRLSDVWDAENHQRTFHFRRCPNCCVIVFRL